MNQPRLTRQECLQTRQTLTKLLFELQNLERVNEQIKLGCPEVYGSNRLNIHIQRQEIQLALHLLNQEMEPDVDPE